MYVDEILNHPILYCIHMYSITTMMLDIVTHHFVCVHFSITFQLSPITPRLTHKKKKKFRNGFEFDKCLSIYVNQYNIYVYLKKYKAKSMIFLEIFIIQYTYNV